MRRPKVAYAAGKNAFNASELNHLSLPLLVPAELEGLGPLQRLVDPPLAVAALHAEDDLLRRLKLSGNLFLF